MKEKQDYIRDIAEVRNMMERSSKFRSLSGLAGIFAGLYALAGAFVAWQFFGFSPAEGVPPNQLVALIWLALSVLVLALGTVFFLSYKKAKQHGEKIWNVATRSLLRNMAVPLAAGGLLLLVFIDKGLFAYLVPFCLLFYGLALFTAGRYTYEELRSLGLLEMALGLLGAWFTDLGLLFWALGFGLVNIIYGIYLHYRYDK